LDRLGELLPGSEPTGLRGHHLPLSTHRPAPARGRVLLAGDALSLINPFTGEGIFYAVLSGALAGAAAARRAGPGRGALTRAALKRRLDGTCGTRAWPRDFPSGPGWWTPWSARPRGIGRLFDRMVGLGLGDGLFDARTIGRITAAILSRQPVTPLSLRARSIGWTR